MKTLITILSMISTMAFAGQERGGGKQVELDYVEMAQRVGDAVQESLRKEEKVFDGFNLQEFRKALIDTQVSALQRVCRETVDLTTGATKSKCMDAEYNATHKLIEFSEIAWGQKSCIERMGHVLHEYGRASGNEDGNYRYSSRVKESQVLKDSCAAYEKDLRCEEKIVPLVVALNKLDGMPTSTSRERDLFLVVLENNVERWQMTKYGMKCNALAEQLVTDFCMKKIASLHCVRPQR